MSLKSCPYVLYLVNLIKVMRKFSWFIGVKFNKSFHEVKNTVKPPMKCPSATQLEYHKVQTV